MVMPIPGPDARRRGQAADGLVADEDHARAEKAHARHDLRGDTGRIQRHALEGGHVGKAVFGNNHDERRRQCHDQVRADSGLFQTVVAFVTDEAAAYPGDEDAKKEFQLCKDGDVHEPPRLLESTIIVICQLWCGSSCCSRQVPKGDMGSGERRFGRGSNTGKAYGFLPDRLQRYKALTAIPRRRCTFRCASRLQTVFVHVGKSRTGHLQQKKLSSGESLVRFGCWNADHA